MKRFLTFGLGLCLLLAGCTVPTTDIVFQTSTIDALLAGVYDGDLSCHDLLEHGDFGIGTFDHLDGEMIVLDGEIYQVKADGKVYRPDLSMKTPFATVCQFESDSHVPLQPGSNYAAVEVQLNSTAPNQNLFYGIKIKGDFKYMKTRSVPGQQKPYPPLKEVTRDQPEFEMSNISGTIVGFRSPAFVKGINVPGYHLHFISDDRTRGGHILKFEMTRGSCEIDVLEHYFLRLPVNTPAFAEADLSQDRSSELEDVEKR
jgi:acetolactate decarboxylase